MGRKKTKKNKGGRGGGRHHSGNSSAGTAHPHVVPTATVEAEVRPVQATEASSDKGGRDEPGGGSQTVLLDDPGKEGGACGGAPLSTPVFKGKHSLQRGGKPGARIELSGLEAELAAVQDLQAAMAATLSNVDTNITKMQNKFKSNEAPQNVADTNQKTPVSGQVTAEPPKQPKDEEKGHDESETKRTDIETATNKERKQEENLKEAKQGRELFTMLDHKYECMVNKCEERKMSEKVFGRALEESWMKNEEKKDDEAEGSSSIFKETLGRIREKEGTAETDVKKEDICKSEEGSQATKPDTTEKEAAEIEVHFQEEEDIGNVNAEEGDIENFMDGDANKSVSELETDSCDAGHNGFQGERLENEVDKGKDLLGAGGIDLQSSVLHVTPALAQYLMEECKKMQDLQKVVEAEDYLPQVASVTFEEQDVVKDLENEDVDRKVEVTPAAKVGHYMSYADAVKASLQAAWEKECEQRGEDAEMGYQEALALKVTGTAGNNCDTERVTQQTKMSDLNSTDAGHVYKYLVSEYEPCMRRLEAEEAELHYQEKLAAKRSLESAPKTTPPTIEISPASDVRDSEDDDEVLIKKEVTVVETPENSVPLSTVDERMAIYTAMVDDCQKVNARVAVEEMEYKYQSVLSKKSDPHVPEDREVRTSPITASETYQSVLSKKSDPHVPEDREVRTSPITASETKMAAKVPNLEEIEITKYLAHECSKMEFLKGAARAEAAYQYKLRQDAEVVSRIEAVEATEDFEEARHAKARRLTDVLEAANMEVVSVVDIAEKEFLLQRESQRSHPWRWVRADTAPAYINVPETVHEPVSDNEAEAEPETRSQGVATDMAGLVFQCKDSCTQTETEFSECCKCGQMALPLDKQFAYRLREEMAQRLALENLVRLLESEAADSRQRMARMRISGDQLENSITDHKAEVTEAKRLAMEYKERCEDLERCLESSRGMVNTLEGQIDRSSYFEGGIDYMLEAKLSSAKAAEAEARVEELQTELLFSKTEVARLLDRLAEHNQQQSEMVPMSVHEQLMMQADSRGNDLHLKVIQLESELAKLKCVKDVWGSLDQGEPPMQGGLGIGFQPLTTRAGVYELPPSLLTKPCTTGMDLPPCLTGLGLESPDSGVSNLTAGLLSNLQAKVDLNPGFVVAPLALQEDMDSDDDAAWSSASEQPKGNTPPPIQNRSSPIEKPALPLKPCCLRQSEKPPIPPKPDFLKASRSSDCNQERPLTPGHEQPTSFDENTSSPKLKMAKKPKGPRERQRPKKYQK